MTLLNESTLVAFATLTRESSVFGEDSASETKTLLTTGQIDSLKEAIIDRAFDLALQNKTQQQSKKKLVPILTRVELFGEKNKSSSLLPLPLCPTSAKSIFPCSSSDSMQELKAFYINRLKRIKSSISNNDSLLFDSFESLWQSTTQNIPAEGSDTVSLYDKSKIAAALSVALWRWHIELGKTSDQDLENIRLQKDSDEKKLLFIQGDFNGIQEFIFVHSSNKNSAKLLRGRSFYVSLLSEFAALRILDALELPPTSVVISAAGKFQIIAPNTEKTTQTLMAIRREIDQWFISNTLGISSISIASVPVSLNELTLSFSSVMKELFSQGEIAKYHRFNLPERETPVLDVDYPDKASPYDTRLPEGTALIQDILETGKKLVKNSFIIVKRKKADDSKFSIFGFTYSICDKKDINFTDFGDIVKVWDYHLSPDKNTPIFECFSTRRVNAYVPYSGNPLEPVQTFENIALCGIDQSTGTGMFALTVLKGDIDNLGLTFQQGIKNISLAEMSSLSRLINDFFTLFLPSFCATEFPNTYTVFAGGDDFFLVGPWLETQRLAGKMRHEFDRYVQNTAIHFSTGLVIVKPVVPPRTMARMAEAALEKAKSEGKNRVTAFSVTASWDEWDELQKIEERLKSDMQRFGLSSSYIYSLLNTIRLAEKEKMNDVEASMWRSHLYYRTVRMALTKTEQDNIYLTQQFLPELCQNISQYGEKLRIPIVNIFYSIRETTR